MTATKRPLQRRQTQRLVRVPSVSTGWLRMTIKSVALQRGQEIARTNTKGAWVQVSGMSRLDFSELRPSECGEPDPTSMGTEQFEQPFGFQATDYCLRRDSGRCG